MRYGPDPSQFGDLRLPSGPDPHPVVVVIHGGFWRARYDLHHIEPLCVTLTAAGAATWNVEYRRVGQPGGGWPGTFHDVSLALDQLRELARVHRLDLTRVITLGHSAGGHLALWLAARSRIPPGDALYTAHPVAPRVAVSLAGVVDLRRAWELDLGAGIVETFMGSSPSELPDRYATASPAALLPLGVPQILAHGTQDEDVPFSLSRGYHRQAVALGDETRLLPFPGAGHFELVDPRSEEWASIQAAVLQLLRID